MTKFWPPLTPKPLNGFRCYFKYITTRLHRRGEIGRLLHANFSPNPCNVSLLRGEPHSQNSPPPAIWYFCSFSIQPVVLRMISAILQCMQTGQQNHHLDICMSATYISQPLHTYITFDEKITGQGGSTDHPYLPFNTVSKHNCPVNLY